LWNINKKNTYIDIGSILDPYLQLKLTRGYLRGAETVKKICTW
jgi:DNA repair photolyase